MKNTQQLRQLRSKIQKHFALPIPERDYEEFTKIVDELDELRGRPKIKRKAPGNRLQQAIARAVIELK